MTGTDGVKSFETLDVQVKALEGDVRDIKTRIEGLGSEIRQALANVTQQFAERQRTPWVAVSGVAAVLVTIAGFIASQAISPITSDIKLLKEQSFPKDEALFRYSVNDKRLTQLELDFRVGQQRRYEELTKQIDRLEGDKLRTK